MLLGTVDGSMLGNMLTGKVALRVAKGVARARGGGYNTMDYMDKKF